MWGIGVGVGEVTTRVITWEDSGVFYYIEQTVQYIFKKNEISFTDKSVSYLLQNTFSTCKGVVLHPLRVF